MGGACLTSVNNAVHSRRPGAESQHQRASGTHPSRSDQSRSPHGPNADPSALPNRPFDTSHLDRPADRPQPVVADERLRRFATCYLAGHPADDPLVSPVTADLSGLPPMLIQAGTGDPFVADAHRLAEHARRHGVPVRLELYPLATHAFHIYWSFLPAAADALQQVGSFIQGVVSDSQAGPKRYTSGPGREE
jgi:acetyl esterase/lipase